MTWHKQTNNVVLAAARPGLAEFGKGCSLGKIVWELGEPWFLRGGEHGEEARKGLEGTGSDFSYGVSC